MQANHTHRQYINLPNGTSYIAIGHSGSTAMCKAIVQQLYPDRLPKTREPRPLDYHNLVRRSATAEGTCLIPVRDPIERFRSHVLFTRVSDVDALLDRIESGENKTLFDSVTDRVRGQSGMLFKFPEHVKELALAAGLTDVGVENVAVGDKPNLTPEQLARVESIYADDIALYESITEAGQTYTPPPEPATDELKAAKIRELESARYQAEVSGIELPDGKEVRTDKETQAELGKALSIISTVNSSLEIDWKFPDGEVVHMDAAQIQEIAGAVFAHVQVTRTTYKDKAALVEAATSKDELDAITF